MTGKPWTKPPLLPPLPSGKELDVKQALAIVRNAFDPRTQVAGHAVAAANSALLNIEIEIATLRTWKRTMEEKLEEIKKPRRPQSLSESIMNWSTETKTRVEDATRMTVCPECDTLQGDCLEKDKTPMTGYHELRVLKALRNLPRIPK